MQPDFHQQGADAIAEYDRAAEEYADAVLREMTLDTDRHLLKRQIVARLLTEVNPETQKIHSATSAEKAVDVDAEYLAHLATAREVRGEKLEAERRMTAARLRASLAIAALRAQEVAA